MSTIVPETVKVENRHQNFEKIIAESEQKEASIKAMFKIANEQRCDKPLVQDQMEGVADDEW